MTAAATIIPIASGKGGVGKSLISANLAIALAEKGYDTIAADLDFGAGNLHTLLGMGNTYAGIGDFLKTRSRKQLSSYLVPTKFPNLRFLAGDALSPFMANISFAQKSRLIGHLERLPAHYILLDLGAGSSFNTIDVFSIAPCGILVTTPQYPALMNMLTFLKNFIFRVIERALPQNKTLRQLVQTIYNQPVSQGHITVRAILAKIQEHDAETAVAIAAKCKEYSPKLLFNMMTHPDELRILKKLNTAIEQNLSLEVDHLGAIFEDRAVIRSVQEGVSLIPKYRDEPAASELRRIANRIIQRWNQPIQNGERLLMGTSSHAGHQGKVS